jgi:hypothetical protein
MRLIRKKNSNQKNHQIFHRLTAFSTITEHLINLNPNQIKIEAVHSLAININKDRSLILETYFREIFKDKD